MLNQIKSAGWLREENFINGKWIAADDDSTIIVEDPRYR